MKARFNFIKGLNAWLLSGFSSVFKAFVTAVVMECCDPALLQRGVWVAVVVLQLLSWFQSCPGGAVTCCQSSSVLMEVGDGCNSQCWMCCSGKERGCSDHSAQCHDLDACSNTGTQITGVYTSASVGPRDRELHMCVAWCFPFEQWVFSLAHLRGWCHAQPKQPLSLGSCASHISCGMGGASPADRRIRAEGALQRLQLL